MNDFLISSDLAQRLSMAVADCAHSHYVIAEEGESVLSNLRISPAMSNALAARSYLSARGGTFALTSFIDDKLRREMSALSGAEMLNEVSDDALARLFRIRIAMSMDDSVTGARCSSGAETHEMARAKAVLRIIGMSNPSSDDADMNEKIAEAMWRSGLPDHRASEAWIGMPSAEIFRNKAKLLVSRLNGKAKS